MLQHHGRSTHADPRGGVRPQNPVGVPPHGSVPSARAAHGGILLLLWLLPRFSSTRRGGRAVRTVTATIPAVERLHEAVAVRSGGLVGWAAVNAERIEGFRATGRHLIRMENEKTRETSLPVCMFCNREVQPEQGERVFNLTGDGTARVVHQTCYLTFRPDRRRPR
jgi:hypothetical protein